MCRSRLRAGEVRGKDLGYLLATRGASTDNAPFQKPYGRVVLTVLDRRAFNGSRRFTQAEVEPFYQPLKAW